MRKLRIVSATRKDPDAFVNGSLLGRTVKGLGWDPRIEASITCSNERGLPHIYNRAIEKSREDEALLFVGGKPLTIKALGTVLRGEFDAVFIETAIEQLRDRYAHQNRPYEIRLTDGGYCMQLRSDFEPERNRVYGFGPRQVRLSQDTLEVLSLVAYRQPISRRSIEEIGKRGAGSHLRQLLQRELVVLERGKGDAEKDVTYRTSPRFLQLFGLRRLEELPQIEDLDFK